MQNVPCNLTLYMIFENMDFILLYLLKPLVLYKFDD